MMATASSPVREVLQQLVELYVVYWAIEKLMDLLKVSMRIPPKFCSKQVTKICDGIIERTIFKPTLLNWTLVYFVLLSKKGSVIHVLHIFELFVSDDQILV